jgi:hypothetical protein
MLRESVDVGIPEILHERLHRFDRADALAHQEQLVEYEKLRLTGERRDVGDFRITVLAVARGTGRLREKQGEKKDHLAWYVMR